MRFLKFEYLFVIIILIGGFFDEALPWTSSPTGWCTDEEGHNFRCDEGGGGGTSGVEPVYQPPPDPGTDLKNEGNRCFNTGNYECAVNNYLKALSYYPNDLTIQEYLRKAQEALGMPTGLTLNDSGNRCFEKGDYDCAINNYKQALVFMPNNQQITENLRNAEAKLQERLKQIQRNNTGISLNESGNRCFEKGDYDCALEYYKQSLDYIPDDTNVKNNLRRAEAFSLSKRAYALTQNGDYAAAVELYKQAVEKAPEETQISQSLEYAITWLEDQAEQKRQEQEYVQLKEEIPDMIANLARDLKLTEQKQPVLEGGGTQKGETEPQTEELQFMSVPGSDIAGKQLRSIESHSSEAPGLRKAESAKTEAGKGFDLGVLLKEGLQQLKLRGVPPEERDPNIPKEEITFEIEQMVSQRTQIRQERKEKEKQLKELEKAEIKDPVKITQLKQEIKQAKEQEKTINFSLVNTLRKAREIKKGGDEQKKEEKK